MLRSTLLLVLLTGAAAAAAVVGDAVCFDGYVMDNYCINRNFLLDAPKLDTLSNPAAHSLHCLVDPGVCYKSGFEMLQDPIGESLVHCRAYELDSTGNTMALELARSLGSPTGCRTCTGDAATGLKKGFRATVHGTISALTSPPTIAVTGVFQTGTACPGGAAFTVPSDTMCSGGDKVQWHIAHGVCMLLSWGLLLPFGVISARLLKHKGAVWFKIHRAVQSTGLLLAVTGWVIALTHFNVFDGGVAKSLLHGGLGMLTMVLGVLQPLNAFLRPHPAPAGEPVPFRRQAWEHLHKKGGYFAVGSGLVTVALGVTVIGSDLTPFFAVAFACTLTLLVCYVLWIRGDKAKGMGQGMLQAQDEGEGEDGTSGGVQLQPSS
jgi:hypothetical protein